MSTEAPRKPSARGYAWDRLAVQIYRRDGAYQDTDGRWRNVCRNWTEAKRLGLGAPCPNNGEDEVWACHSNSWAKYPALRLIDVNVIALCRHCDPDRNPEMRAEWWGDPKEPIVAGWERTGSRPPKWVKGAKRMPESDRLAGVGIVLLLASIVLVAVSFYAAGPWLRLGLLTFAVSAPMWWIRARHRLAVLELSVPLWWLIIVADVDLRYYWPAARHFTVGDPQPFGLQLLLSVILWGACLLACHVVLRHRWLGRGGRAILHGIVRLWGKIRTGK